jgi:hypothetical protein
VSVGIGRGRSRLRGQSLAEFALILPVFLLLTIVVIDGARAYMAQISLVNAVREATMYAIQGHYGEWCSGAGDSLCPAGADSDNYSPDPGNLAYRLSGELSGLDISRATLLEPLCGPGPGLPTTSCTGVISPKYVTVTARYEFDPITPGLIQIWGSSIVLEASSTGRVIT